MRIDHFEVYVTTVRYKEPWSSDQRHYFKDTDDGRWVQRNVIVAIHTDSGLVGYGEAAHSPGILGETAESTIGALRLYERVLKGEDPSNIARLHHLMNMATAMGNRAARCAVDVAAHDLLGKKVGAPVYTLLGGRSRERFVTHITPATQDVRGTVAHTLELVQRGFRVFKVKMSGKVDEDIERIDALLDAVPTGVRITLDPNQGWTPSDTVRAAEAIARHPRYCNNVLIEQPIAADDLHGMAFIARHSRVPIMADESACTPRQIAHLLANGMAHAVNIKISKAGGLRPALEAVAVARAFNVPYVIDEINETRVANTAVAHLAVAVPELLYGGCTCHLLLDRDVTDGTGVRVEEGHGVVPGDEPGLGIRALNKEALTQVSL